MDTRQVSILMIRPYESLPRVMLTLDIRSGSYLYYTRLLCTDASSLYEQYVRSGDARSKGAYGQVCGSLAKQFF